MSERPRDWRRRLGRELSRQSKMSVFDIVSQDFAASDLTAWRLGLTGPPGAGKSSLIAKLAQRWLHCGSMVGVLAVDPSSPISKGALLGDRIRMDSVADDDRLFIRSVASGPCHDGLCHNVVGLLAAMEAAGLTDIILETVGVGQVSYEARNLVDTLVLVLVPESGDTVQAMKAGILELADIYVINKADRPGASQLASELMAVLGRSERADGWRPRIILSSTQSGQGLQEIDEAIGEHRNVVLTPERRAQARIELCSYQLRALIAQRLDELSNEFESSEAVGLARAFDTIVAQMRSSDAN